MTSLRALIGTAFLACTLTSSATLATTTDRPDLDGWASGIWDAAMRGDESRFSALLDSMPLAAGEDPAGDRFRASIAQLRTHEEDSLASRREQRQTAIDEMRTEVEAENLPKALRKAVEAQTMSADLNEALDDAEIMQLIAWAERELGSLEQSRRWLDLQEMLFLLRTFYEDTRSRGQFQSYSDRLEQVNRRVSFIAQYAPRKLHEMRNVRAERLGEETFGEFNPATSVDWKERLDDVDVKMLRAGLVTAAREHIEAEGWRPLLEGGLDAMRVLASTRALSGTFPTLEDAVRVQRWTAFIDDRMRELEDARDGELNRWALNATLDQLVIENQHTLELPNEIILREFGDGALNNLDTYSELIWPDKLRRFQQATAGNFVGVGILIRHNDKREIAVVNPLEGTPAYFAGVKPGDLITEVNGNSTVGWSLNDAVDKITGKRRSTVTLGLKREGEEELLQIPIERDVIKIRSVKGWWKDNLNDQGDPIWDWYVDPENRIAYIRLTQFTEDSFGDLIDAWREINEKGQPNGLVFDLRHNPGGLLTSAVQISNLFVPAGTIVTGEDKDAVRAWSQDARPNFAQFAGVPTVVLVNGGSASASEIVAGCLQAHNAALIVGERSFGKGSVQTIHHVARNCRLKLTTQYYRLPPGDGEVEGRLVHKRPGHVIWGVDPDMVVPMSVTQVRDAIELRQSAEIIPLDEQGNLNAGDPKRPAVTELITKGIDPQLETALLVLQAQALARDADVRHARRDS